MRLPRSWVVWACSRVMHRSVLLKEAVEGLNLRKGSLVIDGTLGAGGHTEAICDTLGGDVKVMAFDLDNEAIARVKARLDGKSCDIFYANENFKDMDKVLKETGNLEVDGILLDLGFSSDQLESSGRGFSFKKDEPLRMTLRDAKKDDEFDASDIVNSWDEEDIANVLYGYGEERFARRIAREIVEAREGGEIKTTGRLVEIVMNAVPAFYRRGRINPATKTFQALRIAVNNELGSVQEVLPKAMAFLKKGGRLAVITFHSLEDRIVKNFFRQSDHDGIGTLVSKKPITPSEEELKENPRARSAKLRIIEKI